MLLLLLALVASLAIGFVAYDAFTDDDDDAGTTEARDEVEREDTQVMSLELIGGEEADDLEGDAGDDTLSGLDGGDTLRGGEGGDALVAGDFNSPNAGGALGSRVFEDDTVFPFASPNG